MCERACGVRMMSNASTKAFTLIELLVVIAIIAILAAILFPVFAQAKEAAKKTAALSDTKEIATAMHLYMNDYDDMTPSTYTFPDGTSVDIYQTFQPYLKNMGIFFSPDWNTVTPACANDNTPSGYFVPPANEAQECLGFGYNWGFGVWAGGALVGPQQNLTNGGSVLPGVSGTGADDPATLAAFGDTYDTRRYTMCAVGSELGLYNGAQKVSDLRYGGSFNFGFLDGHAKSVHMAAYTFNPYANPPGTGYLAV